MIAGWLGPILVVLTAIVLSVAGTLLARRWAGVEILRLNNEVAGFIFAVIGVVYAVLLGFSAVIVWERYEDSRVIVENEANELADLFRDAQVFPAEARNAIVDQLQAYATTVIDDEWPAMARGDSSPAAWEAYNAIWRVYYAFVPETEQQTIWYRESISRLNELGEHRRLRLLRAETPAVPGVLWFVLLGGGAVTIGYSLLFGTRLAFAHVLMNTGLAITIALVLLSILALQDPFSGISRVDQDAFDQFLAIVEAGS